MLPARQQCTPSILDARGSDKTKQTRQDKTTTHQTLKMDPMGSSSRRPQVDDPVSKHCGWVAFSYKGLNQTLNMGNHPISCAIGALRNSSHRRVS